MRNRVKKNGANLTPPPPALAASAGMIHGGISFC